MWAPEPWGSSSTRAWNKMLSPIEKLNKILNLEEKMGYANRAVIGGLERRAQVWGPEAT